MSTEPARVSPGGSLSRKMSTLARRDTDAEMKLRRALHALGLRYRVQLPIPTSRRRTIDVAFTRAHLAVFVDGCFWHACPDHGARPRTNSEWWRWKLGRNTDRDRDTDRLLVEAGWEVLRVWEHEDPDEAALRVRRAYLRRISNSDVMRR